VSTSIYGMRAGPGWALFACVIAFALVSPAQGVTKLFSPWHVANSYDTDGNRCQSKLNKDIKAPSTCPQLCVDDLSACPVVDGVPTNSCPHVVKMVAITKIEMKTSVVDSRQYMDIHYKLNGNDEHTESDVGVMDPNNMLKVGDKIPIRAKQELCGDGSCQDSCGAEASGCPDGKVSCRRISVVPFSIQVYKPEEGDGATWKITRDDSGVCCEYSGRVGYPFDSAAGACDSEKEKDYGACKADSILPDYACAPSLHDLCRSKYAGVPFKDDGDLELLRMTSGTGMHLERRSSAEGQWRDLSKDKVGRDKLDKVTWTDADGKEHTNCEAFSVFSVHNKSTGTWQKYNLGGENLQAAYLCGPKAKAASEKTDKEKADEAEAERQKLAFMSFFWEENPESCGKGTGKIKEYNGGIAASSCSDQDFRVTPDCKKTEANCVRKWSVCALTRLVKENHQLISGKSMTFTAAVAAYEGTEHEYIDTYKAAFDAAKANIGYNYFTGGWWALYIFFICVAATNLIFAIYKFVMEMGIKKNDKPIEKDGVQQYQYGYRRDPVGAVAGLFYMLCTFLWHFLCAFCCLDYYGMLCHWSSHEPGTGAVTAGYGETCPVFPLEANPKGYYESGYLWFDNSYLWYKAGNADVFGWDTDWFASKSGEYRIYVIFACFVSIGFFWNLITCVIKDKLATMYMVRAPLDKSTHVLFWKKKEEPVHMMDYDGFLRSWLNLVNTVNAKLLGNTGVVELCAVETSKEGVKTLSANLQQYFFSDGKFDTKELPTAGKTNEQMLKEFSAGLSGASVATKKQEFGSNFIDIKMNSLLYDIVYEWFNVLIMYEFFFLYIWWLWSYFMPGFFQSVIVVGSLAVKVYVQRKSKSQVQQMARGGQLEAELDLTRFLLVFMGLVFFLVLTFTDPFGFRFSIAVVVMVLVFGVIYSVLTTMFQKQVASMKVYGICLIAICSAVSLGASTEGGIIAGIILAVICLFALVGVVFTSPTKTLTAAVLRVKRDNKMVDVKVTDLVPGDVFEVGTTTVPCDAFLIQGSCVCDEAMLTGEAVPVPKVAIPNDASDFLGFNGTGKRHMISAGTECQVSNGGAVDSPALAVALSTGAATKKGELIRNILTPQPVSFIYTEHLVFCYVLLFFESIIVFILTGYFQNWQHTSGFLYGTFTISQIVSPLLPACLVWALSAAAARLGNDKGILCTNLERINMLGKVKIFCFDKTGTLTQQGLDFFGCLPVNEDGKTGRSSFGELDNSSAGISDHFKYGLASCHTVDVDSTGKFIGNPVDIKLFEQGAKGWTLQKSGNSESVQNPSLPGSPSLEYVKKFPFDHAKMLSSVIVRKADTGLCTAYVKGAYEHVAKVCNQSSIPDNYKAKTESLARDGYYVLAMGKKDMSNASSEVLRNDVEQGIELMGLMIFRNELKPDTAEAMEQIIAGDMRPVMITGDNALTGVHIARACGMIRKESKVLLGDLNEGSGYDWKNVDTNVVENLGNAMKESATLEDGLELAVTQRLFDKLLASDATVVSTNKKFKELMPYIRIFGRMNPNGKINVVKEMMTFAVTAMCGDGGNDAGALRTAHAGLALSEAEASLVAPFSSSNRSIMQCVELVKAGRCALATTFAAFRYLVFYGQTMGFLSLAQYYFGVVMSEACWVYIDVFINVIMSQLVLLPYPAEKLAPRRPSAKIFGAHNVISSTSIVLVNLLFLVIAFFTLNGADFYKCKEFAPGDGQAPSQWWLLGDNYEAETIAFVVIFQFINSGAIVNFGSHFRAPSYKNYGLVFYYVGLMVFSFAILISDSNWATCVFRVNCGDESWMIENGYVDEGFETGEKGFAFEYFGAFGMIARTMPESCQANIGTLRVLGEKYPDGCPPKALVWGHMYDYKNIYPTLHRWKMVLIVFSNCVLNLLIEYLMLTVVRDIYREKNPRATGQKAVIEMSNKYAARKTVDAGAPTSKAMEA
jgi:predicted P-type ATPase